MPKGRRQPARDAKATATETQNDVPVKGKYSKPKAAANISDRPQTRAWLRAQHLTASVPAQVPSRRGIASVKAASSRNTKNIQTGPAPGETDPKEARSLQQRVREAKNLATSTRSTKQQLGRLQEFEASNVLSRKTPELPVPERPELSSWLDKVQPISPEVERESNLAPSSSVPPDPSDKSSGSESSSDEIQSSMESSNSVSGASNFILSDGASTPKPGGEGKMKRLIFEKLRTRRALPDPRTPDEKTEQLKSLFGLQKPILVPFKDTKILQEILTKFLQKCEEARPRENSYADIEELSNSINEWKPTVNLNTITNQDFESDLAHCANSNEAVFQRTVLMSIIDRWQLNDMFDFNCEGHWSLQGTYPLPSSQGPKDKVTGPKPDLAIFFRLKALTGDNAPPSWAPVPPKLRSCIWPDAFSLRCFPFVFIEAKKGYHDLTFAVYANMHSASQALLNIYKWMEKAHKQQAFFDQVRLFSIAINAEKIIARVHRAVPFHNDNEDGLVFLYDDLCTLYRYSRDDASQLIRAILVQYGIAELHGLLKETFEEVSTQVRKNIYRDDEPPKRKNGPAIDASTKRARVSRTASLVPDVTPSSSFDAGRIALADGDGDDIDG